MLHIGNAHVPLGLMALEMGKYLELKAKISLKWCGVFKRRNDAVNEPENGMSDPWKPRIRKSKQSATRWDKSFRSTQHKSGKIPLK